MQPINALLLVPTTTGRCTGVVLYVMLAGCLPFEEPDLATLFRRISRAQYDVPPWFSSEQRQLLAKMLVIDPDERCVKDQNTQA